MLKNIKDKPIRTQVLLFFLPIIILSVMLTGLLSYLIAIKQLKDNAYNLLKDSVDQTSIFVNDKFTTMFEQLTSLENDSALQNLVINRYPSLSGTDKYDDIITVDNRLNDIYLSYYELLDSVYFYTKSGREIKLLRDNVPKHIGIDLNQWLETYNWSDKGYYWLNNHYDTVFDTVDKRSVISVFNIIGHKDSEESGILLFNIRSETISNILKNVKISSNGYIALISKDGMMTSKTINPKFDIGSKGITLLRNNLGKSGDFVTESVTGEKIFVVYNNIQINNWMVAAIVPEKDILQSAEQIKYISLIITILLILISSMIVAFLSGTISSPIKYLSMQVKKFENGDFDTNFDIQSANEIGILANGLSSLVGTVKRLLEDVQEEQEKKRKVELLALQSQINPHFLYNTLGSIKHLIDMKENERASKMTSALTKFFMIGISKGKEIITVREEIEHIKNYLLIQKMRYSRDFDFSFDISEEILDCRIIKLTLQPIIENSIYHGIKNKPETGIIKVSGRRNGEYVFIEIYDDGVGMSEEKLGSLKKAINLHEIEENPITFGLKNVNQRIILHFGRVYGISIDSALNEYTKVTVKIPF